MGLQSVPCRSDKLPPGLLPIWTPQQVWFQLIAYDNGMYAHPGNAGLSSAAFTITLPRLCVEINQTKHTFAKGLIVMKSAEFGTVGPAA